MLVQVLVRDPEGNADDAVEIAGVRWQLTSHDLGPSSPSTPSPSPEHQPSDAHNDSHNSDNNNNNNEQPFTCISYSWGPDKEPSPFHPTFQVSTRTIPALTELARSRPSCRRVWLDAFCVPQTAPHRAATLEAMGYIYSRAQEVLVVLSAGAGDALRRMNAAGRSSSSSVASAGGVGGGGGGRGPGGGMLEGRHLDALEQEDWVSRAWTYQEAVNSRRLSITCVGFDGPPVDSEVFLNHLGHALSLARLADDPDPEPDTDHDPDPDHDSSTPVGGPSSARSYPRLDIFQDVIADHQVSAYEQRSAFQVMSNMDRRTQHRDEDHFYAMVGAVSRAPASSYSLVSDNDNDGDNGGGGGGGGSGGDDGSRAVVDPCELFMAVCERRGDYSFIYSAAERDGGAGRRWRPVAGGDLPAVIAWHAYGEFQSAHMEGGSTFLDYMMVPERAPLSENGIRFIDNKFSRTRNRSGDDGSSAAFADSVYEALREMNFKGGPKCLTTSMGLFYTYKPVPEDKDVSILVSTEVRWSFGAPGLVHYSTETSEIYLPGAFVGKIDNTNTRSVKVS